MTEIETFELRLRLGLEFQTARLKQTAPSIVSQTKNRPLYVKIKLASKTLALVYLI